MKILPALSEHHASIAAIRSEAVRTTTAVFHTKEWHAADVAALIAERRAMNSEMWVAEGPDGVVLGFATYGRFRSGDGYDDTMEHSIFLTAEARGQGVGRALMQTLEAHAAQQGVHVMVAAIDGANTAAQAFHAALGYEQTGWMPHVGRKFGRRLDLALMQKTLAV